MPHPTVQVVAVVHPHKNLQRTRMQRAETRKVKILHKSTVRKNQAKSKGLMVQNHQVILQIQVLMIIRKRRKTKKLVIRVEKTKRRMVVNHLRVLLLLLVLIMKEGKVKRKSHNQRSLQLKNLKKLRKRRKEIAHHQVPVQVVHQVLAMGQVAHHPAAHQAVLVKMKERENAEKDIC